MHTAGVQLSTHDFLLHFCSFFLPLSSGGACFCPVFWSQVPTKHGGERVFLIFLGPNTGGRASSAKFFCETQGANGRQICCPLFFLLRGGFWAIPGGSSRAGTGKKKAEEEEKEEAEDEGGEE